MEKIAILLITSPLWFAFGFVLWGMFFVSLDLYIKKQLGIYADKLNKEGK